MSNLLKAKGREVPCDPQFSKCQISHSSNASHILQRRLYSPQPHLIEPLNSRF